MICPKCGRPVDESAVICPGCDFILDSGFLGEEVLDEEKDLRPGRGGIEPAVFNLADAVILGDIDDSGHNFETSDTGFHIKESTGARLYVSGRSQALMAPDAIPARVSGQTMHNLRLTPFESHVLNYIDGQRPVETIKRETGLDEVEVKTALATLADKGVIRVVGRALVEIKPMEKRPERRSGKKDRMRRELVGAVALVGGESDRAIEDAFRTQTSIPMPDFDGPRPTPKPLHRPETDVFHKILDDAGHDIISTRHSERTRNPDPRSMTVDRSNPSFLDSSSPDSLDLELQRAIDGDDINRRTQKKSLDGPPIESDGFDEFGDASQLELDSQSESDLHVVPPRRADLSSELSETGSAPDLEAPDLAAPAFRPAARAPLDAHEEDDPQLDDDDDVFGEDTANALPKDIAKGSDAMSFGDEFTSGTVARMNKSAIDRLANSEIDQPAAPGRRPPSFRPEPTRSVMNPLSESLSSLLSDADASEEALKHAADALRQVDTAGHASPQLPRPNAGSSNAVDAIVDGDAPRAPTQVSALSSLLNESVDNFTDDAYSEIYDDLSSEEGEHQDEDAANDPLAPAASSSFADDLSEDEPMPPVDAPPRHPIHLEATGLHALASLNASRDPSDVASAGPKTPDVDDLPSASSSEDSADDRDAIDADARPPASNLAQPISQDLSAEDAGTEASPVANVPGGRARTEAVEVSIDGSLAAGEPSSFESFEESDIVGRRRAGGDDGGGASDGAPSIDDAAPSDANRGLNSLESIRDRSAESLLPAPSFEMAAPNVNDDDDPAHDLDSESAEDDAFLDAFSASSDRAEDDDDDAPIAEAATDPRVALSASDRSASEDDILPASADASQSASGTGRSVDESLSEESSPSVDDSDHGAVKLPHGPGLAIGGALDSGATAIFEHAGEFTGARGADRGAPAAPPPDDEKTGAFEMPPSDDDVGDPRPGASSRIANSEIAASEIDGEPSSKSASDEAQADASGDDDSGDDYSGDDDSGDDDSGDDDSGEFEDEQTAAIDVRDISDLSDNNAGDAGDFENLDPNRTLAFNPQEARIALGLDDDNDAPNGDDALESTPDASAEDAENALSEEDAADDVFSSSDDASWEADGDASDPEVTAHLTSNPFDEQPAAAKDNDAARPAPAIESPAAPPRPPTDRLLGPPLPNSDFLSDDGDNLGITDNVDLGNDSDLEAYVPKNAATALLGALSDVADAIEDAPAPEERLARGRSGRPLVDPPSEEMSGFSRHNSEEGKTGVFIPESSLVKRKRANSDPAHRPPALVEASEFGSHSEMPFEEEVENTRTPDLHSAATGIMDDVDIDGDDDAHNAETGTQGKATISSIADLDTHHLAPAPSPPSDEDIFEESRPVIRPKAPVASSLRAAAGRVQKPVEESGPIGAPPVEHDPSSFAYPTGPVATRALLDELSDEAQDPPRPEEETDYARNKESNSRFESFPDAVEPTMAIESLSSDESSLPDFNDATAAIEPLGRQASINRSDVFATEHLALPPRLAAQRAADDAKPRVGNPRGNAAPIGNSSDPELYSDESPGPVRPGRPGTDMHGKARALFEDAMRDYQAGRVGAARMNAKLAAIYDPANEEYRHALEQWERAPTGRSRQTIPPEVALYERAQEAESEGDVERALELLREGIALNPDVPAIHNRLGVLLALQMRDYDAAAASIRRAIELEPDNLHYKNNLGKIVARARQN